LKYGNFFRSGQTDTMGSVSESTTIPPVESASALVTFLRCEADMADERARRLRAQADQLAMQYGVDSSALGTCCCCTTSYF